MNKNTKFKKGSIPWNKGIKYSKELKEKLNISGLKLGHGWNKGKECDWVKNNPQIFKDGHETPQTAFKKDQTRGNKNKNWKGGITPLTRLIRSSTEYKEWIFAVFTRDNFTCVKCGEKNCKNKKVILNADHIDLFSTIFKRNKINTLQEALDCKEFWDINNGQTLCTLCHKIKTKEDLKILHGSKV